VQPLRTVKVGGRLLVIFPEKRFDLEVAAQLGKKAWTTIVKPEDNINGAEKDRLFEDGADFLAQVEFLSEVFLDGKPLGKSEFEDGATTGAAGIKSMEVHFPRFGRVLLVCKPDGSRFVTSRLTGAEEIVAAI